MRLHLAGALCAVLLLSSCATPPDSATQPVAPPEVTPFSNSEPGASLPPLWRPWVLSRLRPRSRYELVRDGETTVLKGIARNSASGLDHRLDVDPAATPLLTWRWKLVDLPPTTDTSPDDSPVRVVVSFDGDLDKLSFGDRMFYTNFRLFTGQQLPYAALMYIWGSRSELETIKPAPRTGRVQMIVVEKGRDDLGKWREMTRNVREDFRRAFGEEPGRVISVGIMAETDETGRDVTAYFGNLYFHRAGQ